MPERPVESIDDLVTKWNDLFDRQIADGTRNDLDLNSDRLYTPEKWRVYRDTGSGYSRELLQYQNISGLSWFSEDASGDEDVFVLSPSQGNKILFESAKLLQYTVSYTAEQTFASALSRDLENGDVFTTGLNTSGNTSLDDGYFFQSRGTDHGANEGVLQVKRSGNVVGDEIPVTLDKALTFFRRFVNEYAWYNIAGSKWSETTSTSGNINENQIGTLTTEPGDNNAGDGGRGPISGNGRAVIEIERDSNSSSLDVYCGSSSFKNLGTPTDELIGRTFEVQGISHTGGGNWEPAFAIRVKPGYENSLVSVRSTKLIDGSTDYKLKCIACDPSKVLDGSDNTLSDSDFSSPSDLNSNLTPIEVTDASTVDEIPDDSGATATSQTQTGGYQLSFDVERTSGSGQNTVVKGADFNEPKLLLDGDYGVVVVEASSSISGGKVFCEIASS